MQSISEQKLTLFKHSDTPLAEYGICEEAIAHSALAAGLTHAHGRLLFPGGINQFLQELSAHYDHELHLDSNIKGTTNKIHHLLFARITKYNFKPELLELAVSYLSSIPNTPLGLNIVANSCSHIWVLAGDKSNDMNYYSKRFLLGLVYVKATRFYLSDNSVNNIETYKKIGALLAAVLRLGKVKHIFTLPQRFVDMVKRRLEE